MRVSPLAALAVLGLAACSASPSTGKGADSDAKAKKFTIFLTTELKGTTEPCGCNSDPLGDLARTAALIKETRAEGPVLVVDGGSLLYSVNPIPELLEAQETLKADLLVDAFTKELEVAAIGLGPYDLAKGPEAVRPPRHAVNLAEGSKVPTAAPRVVEVGGVQVGIFGVVEPNLVAEHGVDATDPFEAGKSAVEQLRQQGAEVIVALVHMERRRAQAFAEKVPGIHFAVIGQGAAHQPHEIRAAPDKVGTTWLVQPADRGQIVTRLDVTVRGEATFVDAIGRARAEVEIAAIGDRLQALRNDLTKWKAAPDADPAFIATKENELVELEQTGELLKKEPLRVPTKGSYFVMSQVPIKRGRACDATVQEMKTAYDAAVGKANLAAAAGLEPPPPGKGQAGYAGIEECGFCHSAAVEFWKNTRHAKAWETLEKVNKELNYDCISCHVTGWDQPGGATLAHNEELRDVQCETCHGPGSIHVDANGKEKPKTMLLTPPESLCQGCHNEEHSDTFDYQAYLRDVTGPGHGEAFRKELGDGPTGHQLRSEALRKAGLQLGAGCLK